MPPFNVHSMGKGPRVMVIAEAGVNHNGKLSTALRLVDAARAAGCDAVKFQTFQTERLVIPSAPKAPYQNKTVPTKTQFAMLKSLELSFKDFEKIFRHCEKTGILFLSTPFDLESAHFLRDLGLAAFKIGSGDLDNAPLLRFCAKSGKPVILSTGMSTLSEVRKSVDFLRVNGVRRLVLLHCTSNYPTQDDHVNLRAMDSLRRTFHCPVGFSDHTLGIEISLAAAARGASVIEKHITLNNRMEGPDHSASLMPKELGELVTGVRRIELSLGSPNKRVLRTEWAVRQTVRRSLVVDREISKGEHFSRKNLSVRRPGTGLSPWEYFNVLGRCARRTVSANTLLRKEDIG